MRAAENRTGRLLQNAVQRDYLEPIMAGLLAVFVVSLHLLMVHDLNSLLLDCVALLAAALTGRWPRAAGAALAAVLVAYLPVAADWIVLGMYATVVVLLCYGVRGRRLERAWFTAIYLVLVVAYSWFSLPPNLSVAPYAILWAVFFGVAWLAGSAWHGLIRSVEESRLRAALEERHELARELHDSVANALAAVSLRAEQAKLNGQAGVEELSAIADEVARAVAEFGQIVQVLRRESDDAYQASAAVAVRALIDEAAERLRTRGFKPNLTWTGPFAVLPAKAGHTLGRVIEEATNNMLRYGDPAAESAIVVEVSADLAEFAFINRPRRGRGAGTAGSGFGRTSMAERIAALGGSFSSSQSGETWLTSFQVPITVQPAIGSRP